jgi:hypothetical protein
VLSIALMNTLSRMLVLAVASFVAVSASACSGSSESPESTSGGTGSGNPPAGSPSTTPSGGDGGGTNPGSTDSGNTDAANNTGACGNIAGTWSTSGTCGNDQCVIVQSGCNTNFECSDGAASFSGTVAGSDVAYAGTTALGTPGSCRGLLSGGGTTITGSCQIGGAACTFTAKKK